MIGFTLDILWRLILLVVGLGVIAVGGGATWAAILSLRRERERWRELRRWIEYRSQGEQALFAPAPNLEQLINRLAQSHTEPLRRRLEALERNVGVGPAGGGR